MPVLSYEMAVPFMFNFIKIKLQEVGKHKPDTFQYTWYSLTRLRSDSKSTKSNLVRLVLY